ncbi:MAG: class I SAM-dependent methyltransferase [Thermoplasmatota archaeon]
MRRSTNPWDRFYRYQPQAWRGEHRVEEFGPWSQRRVLELGAGNGKMVRPLARSGANVVALDVSWNALQTLERDVPRVLADAQALPFADATFDAVLDIHCTGHLMAEGRRRAAHEAARVLRSGGTLWVERLAPDDLRTTTGSWTGEPGTRIVADGRTTHFSDRLDLEAEFAAAGLAVVASERRERPLRHRGREVLRSAWRIRFAKP